jgi:hypothetical protein
MLTHKQLFANMMNAQNSTGPQGDANKRKVSLNSLKHGFAGQTCFVPEHEREDYIAHFKSFRAEYKPATPTEQFMVQSLAELSWSTQQIRAMSNNIISLLGTKSSPRETGSEATDFTLAQAANVSEHLKEINLLGIYEQRKQRLFNSTRRELLQIQTDRKLAEKEELETASPIRKATKQAFQPWQPAEDGFACSIEELDRYISRADRLKMYSGGAK